MHRPRSTPSASLRALFLAFLIAGFALVATACGGGDAAVLEAATTVPTAAPTSTPTPSPTATPTPTPTPGPVSPLNGTDVSTESTRRVLGIKIDNHPNARPQSGIEQADLMVEIWVEGVTRFLALWQGSDSEFVGPIRSMRPTDFAIQNALESTFVNSGGQGWIQSIGNSTNVRWFSEPRGTFRSSGRFAPHNLYGNTEDLRALDSRGDYEAPLAPLFDFGEMPGNAGPATEIVTSWSNGYVASWSWDGSEYLRSISGAPHNYVDPDGEAQQISADTLVMLEMSTYQAGGGSGSSVPASNTTGTGTAWVFADGRVSTGTWARETDAEWFTFAADDGSTLLVPPGRLWLILPFIGGVTFS